MKKTMITMLAGIAMGAMTTVGAGAVTIGVNPGNDPFPNSITVGDITSMALAKCDLTANFTCVWENGNAPGDYTDAFTITMDPDNKGGTWTFDPMLVTGANPVLFPLFVATKGGPDFVLEQVANSFGGTFSTFGILVGAGNQPEVSHISFYNGVAPVPLPAAAWLLLSGIGGLGVMGWRKNRAAA